MSSAAPGSVFVDIGCLRKNEVGRLKVSRRNGSVLRVRASVASSQQSLKLAKPEAQKSEKTVRIGVLGASGYTGAEIIRLLANHPQFGITLMTADRKAGQSIGSVFPHLVTQDLPDMIAVKDADFSDVDAVFCCLPHGTTQEIIKRLPRGLKIVDLSAVCFGIFGCVISMNMKNGMVFLIKHQNCRKGKICPEQRLECIVYSINLISLILCL